MKVYLNAGHGLGKTNQFDSGAVGPWGLEEQKVTHIIAPLVEQYLVAADVEVVYPGIENLNDAVKHANGVGGVDLFISIHCNAADDESAHGTETWYGGSGASIQLAHAVQAQVVGAIGTTDRGCKHGTFAVLRNTHMPAILIETAFISNPDEETLLGDAGIQDDIARAIARGVTDYMLTL